MILIRAVQKKDAKDLLSLAQTPGMFNLPTTREGMMERIELAQKSFKSSGQELTKTKYVFVAEDLAKREVVATSMIAGQHGTEQSPHYYFKVGTEKHFSPAIQTGFIHGTLFLKAQTDGPSELGALLVNEKYRNHPARVGRQIFFARFLYLHLHRARFKSELLAELLPPLNKKGHSPLWEAIGRRFTNLDYWEADALSAKNKEFIFDLFPSGKIYTTFLSADARNAIGKVGVNTEPVLHLLKRIGFQYQNEIDPFDGGPHLRAKVDDLKILKKVKAVNLGEAKTNKPELVSGLITACNPSEPSKGDFSALSIEGSLEGDTLKVVPGTDLKQVRKILKLGAKELVFFLPYF